MFSALSFNFILGELEDFVLSLLDESLLVVSSLLFLSAFLGTDLGFLLSCSAALGSFDPAETPFLLLLSLVLAVLALSLDFLLTIPLCLFLLLTALSLVPVEFFKILVFLGGVEALKLFVDLFGIKLLLKADINNLVVIEDLCVVLARNFLIVLHNVPLFLVQFDDFLVGGQFLWLSCGARFFPSVVLSDSAASAASVSASTTTSTELAAASTEFTTATIVASKAGFFAVKFIGR